LERRNFLFCFGAGLASINYLRPNWTNANSIENIGASNWNGLLGAGQFIPAKMPLSLDRVVLPRPDAETSPRAYHRNGHMALPYELPIVVQGGAWPFVYELVSAPAGAILGRNFGDAGYGILRWTPTQDGPFSFTVRVSDQDGMSIEFSWSGLVGTDWIRFVDAVNGSDTIGTGSRAQPWRSLAHAYANTINGRALGLRAGTYQSPANAISMGTSDISSLIGWPGEAPLINCSALTSGEFAWYNSNDTFVSHVHFLGGSATAENPRYFASLSTNHRCYQYRLHFDSPPTGTATAEGGNDNNSCMFLGNGGDQRRYVAQVHCTFRNLPIGRNGFSGIDTYQTRYLVVADNLYDVPAASGCSRYALWLKAGGQEDITVRGNRWAQGWGGASLINIYMAVYTTAPGSLFRNIEVCYNTVVSTSNTGWSSIAINLGQASQDGPRGPIWVYRNTVSGLVSIDKRDWPLQISFENDVIVHDAQVFGGTTASANVMMIDPNDPQDRFRDPATRPNIALGITGVECHRRSSDGVLDASFRLQGAWRNQYLGTHGAEILVPDSLFEDGFDG
jgi:hypothetical protein